MKSSKFLCALVCMTAVAALVLSSCAKAETPAAAETTAEIPSAPAAVITAAGTESASYRALELNIELGSANNFIFRGEILSITEKKLAYCEIKVNDVLYGTAAKAGQTIRIMTDQVSSTRIGAQMKLVEGKEYYFITHVLNDEEKQELKKYEPCDISLFDSIYSAMPILGDFVYLNSQWPIPGAKPADLPAFVEEAHITSVVPLEQFELEFRKLIAQYKK